MGKVSTTEPWIKVSPQIIDVAAYWQSVTVTVDVSFLLLEKQTTGYINIESNAGPAKIEIKVTASNKSGSGFKAWMLAPIIVGIFAIIGIANNTNCQPLPKLQVSTTPANFSNLKPGSYPLPDTRTIRNTGGLPLKGTVISNDTWFTISPLEIDIKPDQTMDLKISANTAGMTFGQQKTGTITIDTNGGKATIPINLSITKVIFEDDFSIPDSEWNMSQSPYYEMGYKQGAYSIKAIKKDFACRNYHGKLADLNDFVVEVDVKWLTAQSASNGSYSIGVRSSATGENAYRYAIGDGNYTVEKFVNSQRTTLKAWTTSNAINKGISVNRMKATCLGSSLKFYANDTLLCVLTDDSLTKGMILFFVQNDRSDAGVEALFDNFKVSVP
jgi:hypothetical protein